MFTVPTPQNAGEMVGSTFLVVALVNWQWSRFAHWAGAAIRKIGGVD